MMIEIKGLRKSFGNQVVLDGIDLEVAARTIFALHGPNGAGKTTTVHILSTLLPADGGDVRVAGHDLRSEPDAVRAAIGVTGQFSAVDGFLTGEENLLLMADLFHLEKGEGRRLVRYPRPGGIPMGASGIQPRYHTIGGIRHRFAKGSRCFLGRVLQWK
jgi:ABC-2 type transport system ATP-binding protein